MGHRIYKGSTGVYAKYDPEYLAESMRALSIIWKEAWTAAEAWLAVHMLSTPVLEKPRRVLKKRVSP